MEVSDIVFVHNLDWDPSYLQMIIDRDFFDFSELWSSDMEDRELVDYVNKLETYCPIVEDISMEDEELCQVVESIEHE